MKKKQLLSICFLMFNCIFLPLSHAVQSMPVGAGKSAANELDYAIMEVNGERRLVKNSQRVTVVKGDVVKIIDLYDHSGDPVPLVNLIGFSARNARIPREDRGYAINTARNLSKRWSLGRQGKEYAIIAEKGGKEIGRVVLELINPVLSYAVLKVNGEEIVAKPAKFLYLKASDKLKVERVVTNIPNDQENVTVKMYKVPFESPDRDVDYKLFELRFYREDLMVARIPMQIENK